MAVYLLKNKSTYFSFLNRNTANIYLYRESCYE